MCDPFLVLITWVSPVLCMPSDSFGIALGLMMFLIFSSYGLGMWYGAREVARDLRRGCVGGGCKSGGDVLTVFWSILNGAMVSREL